MLKPSRWDLGFLGFLNETLLGFGIPDLGFGIWDSGFSLGFGIWDSHWDLGFRIWDLGFGILGFSLGFGIRFTLQKFKNQTRYI